MIKGHPLKELKSPQAKELAEWHSIQVDLKKIIAWLILLMSNLESLKEDDKSLSPIDEALWVASVVFYARCFDGGVRASLQPSIYEGLNGDPLGAHKFYVDMRSKRIAHSVNAYEQYTTGIVCTKIEGDWKVLDIAPFLISHTFPTTDGVTTLLELTKVACNYATKQIKELSIAVKAQACGMTPEEIERANNLGFRVPGPGQSGNKRS
ncbi:hypothetical protein EPO04_02530 [Patescibacteria group bacterium]|nr:MAG: hypothetical protein EPO04_02530 [Patescibacteria group bacterium]